MRIKEKRMQLYKRQKENKETNKGQRKQAIQRKKAKANSRVPRKLFT